MLFKFIFIVIYNHKLIYVHLKIVYKSFTTKIKPSLILPQK